MRRGEDIKTALIEEGRKIGFDSLGVSGVELPPVEKVRFADWLSKGMHGTMDWLARRPDGRSDPETLLGGARSVLIGTVNYFDPGWKPLDGGGRISRYAGGRDYHKVIRGLWKKMLPALDRLMPGVQVRWFVDSAPILEKAYAEQAGIGWRGKNSNVIAVKSGSYFFLGGMVIDRELPPDSPAVDRCGSCTRCIDACPTDAIAAPYIVDSRRCISYLTIEHKGDVDDDLESRSGEWLFGCDICQEVCPWNRFSVAARIDSLSTRPGVRDLTLERAAGLDQDSFDRLFRGTPVRRAGWERFHRAVQRALRNRKENGKGI